MIEDIEKRIDVRRAECLSDPRTNAELVNLALTELDDEKAWGPVVVMHYRGSQEVLDVARHLCASDCPQEKILGANILGQLGVPKRSFPGESVTILLRLLEAEADAEVLEAVCIALGHQHDPRAIAPLARLKNHPSADVRFGAIFGLHGFEDELAITTLIELSNDREVSVRDWATFGLGTQIESDTPAIRDALMQRLQDPDAATRGEALVGLARRKDNRVVEPLIEALSVGFEGSFVLEAAAEIGDPRLAPLLVDLKNNLEGPDKDVEEAIRKCMP